MAFVGKNTGALSLTQVRRQQQREKQNDAGWLLRDESLSDVDGECATPVRVTGRRTLTSRRPLAIDEFSPLASRLTSMAVSGTGIAVHVTSTVAHETTSDVARGLAAATARIPGNRVLLLHCHAFDTPGLNVEGPLPDLLDAYQRHAHLEVAAVDFRRIQWYAAAWTGSYPDSGSQTLMSAMLAVRATFSLTVVDWHPSSCPYPIPIDTLAPKVLMVVGTETTPIADALRLKQEVETMGANILGVIMKNGPQERRPR